MRTYLNLFFLIFSFITTTYAQDKSYRNYKYKWSQEKPVIPVVNQQFANEPAVVLDEKTKIEILEDRVLSSNLRFNYLIEKKEVIKYQKKEGIDKYAEFNLPETFDPLGSYYGLSEKQKETIHRPKGDYDVLIYFASRIIKPDGTIKESVVTEKTEVEEYFLNPAYKNYVNESFSYGVGNLTVFKRQKHYAVKFKVTNLEVNDVLEVCYKVQHVFMPSRIFFHSTLPKQTMELELKAYCYGRQLYFVNQFNGAVLKDSLLDGRIISYKWLLNNLNGCVNEKGSRIYKELPYFSVHRNEGSFGVMDEKSGEITKLLPYSWGGVMAYFVSTDAYGGGELFKEDVARSNPEFARSNPDFFNSTNPDVGKSVDPFVTSRAKDDLKNPLEKSNIEIKKWIDEKSSGIADSNWIAKSRKLHNDVADNFDFQNDSSYFVNEDSKNERLGNFIEQRKLREISRFRFYTRMFESLNATYYKTILTDKRVEQIVFDRFENPESFKISYSIPYKNSTIFIHPKEHRFGWYENELPFYYEDITSIMIPQSIRKEETYKTVMPINYINVKTPYSEAVDNQRSTNSMVSFHPDTGVVRFDTKVDLKGQYSTMTRGTYLHDYYDASLNEMYAYKIWRVQDDVKEPKLNIIANDHSYPFAFVFRTNYSSSKILLQNKTGSYFLSLKNWFNYIIEDDLNAEKRKLSYYPDFTGRDTYRYYIKCGKNASVVNASDFEKNIESDVADYICRITQPSPDIIMIESSIIIKKEVIKPTDVKLLDNIYQAATNLNKGLLELKFN